MYHIWIQMTLIAKPHWNSQFGNSETRWQHNTEINLKLID